MNIKLNTWIYFYHLDKFCILPDYPESITDSMPSSFSDQNALARTAPVFAYKYSGPRTINVSLKLHRDMMRDINKNVSNLKDNVVDFSDEDYIDVLIRYLQSISLPKYNAYSSNSKAVVPPMIAIRFGNSIFIKGVVNSSVQTTYTKPILFNDKYAIADVSFSVFEVDPYDAEAVVELGSFRGMTRTFKDGIFKETSSAVSVNQTNRVSGSSENSLTGSIKIPGTDYIMPKKKEAYASTTMSLHGGHGGNI